MIRITTDSTCDLPKSMVEEYGIGVLPLIVTLGDEEFDDDGINVTQDKIFDFVLKNNVLPKTAARSIPDFVDFFDDMLKTADEIIHIGIGADLSSCYRNAYLAKDELESDKIHIIDSKNLSLGTGNLVLEAAKLAKQGLSSEEIIKKINYLADRNQSSFMVEKLDYLYKGGRVSAFSFSIGSMLRIKPRLQVLNGVIQNTGKDIGPVRMVLKKYIDSTLSKFKPLNIDQTVFLAHTIHDKDLLNFVMDYIRSKGVFADMCENYAGSVITSHCGPNTLGIFYFGEEGK